MAFLENKRREEEKHHLHQEYSQPHPQSATFKKGHTGDPLSPTSQGGNPSGPASSQQTSYSMSKLQQKEPKPEEDKKIAMWLPSFTPVPQGNEGSQAATPGQHQQPHHMSPNVQRRQGKEVGLMPQQTPGQMSAQSIASVQDPKQSRDSGSVRGGNQQIGFHLNATASSSATFVDDGRSALTSTTLVSSANKGRTGDQAAGLKHRGQASQGTRSPLFSETNKESSSDSQSQSNYRAAFGQSGHSSGGNPEARSGYIPEAHSGKPRSIQSNQDKQRLFNASSGSNNSSNQSSAGPTQPNQKSDGFDRSQISDRLQLLKSTNKYKPKFEPAVGGSGDGPPNGHDQYGDNALIVRDAGNTTQTQTMGYTQLQAQEQQLATQPHSMYNGGKRQGPVRAAHLKVPEEQKQSVGNKKMSAQLPTSVQLKQQRQGTGQQFNSSAKPPTVSQYSNFTDARGASATQYDECSRASSIDYNQAAPHHASPGGVSQSEKKPTGRAALDGHHAPQTLADIRKQDSSGAYETEEKPLASPDQQVRAAVELLKSSDWSKTFEACNTIKRGVMFHKHLFSHPSTISGQVFKDVVKPVDSLRSQVSKNACLLLSVMFAELPPRDVDQHIDAVMPTLLKRSTDTNAFISSEAERTLITICNNCTETRVFASLQQQSLKSTGLKEKVCLCYTVFIERLAHKLKSFRDLERLVQTVVRFLGEAAVEVRNQAKYAVLTM